MSSILSHFRAAIEYFNWPLGDMTTKGHIRSLNEAADEIERLQAKLFRKDERIKAWKACSDEYEKECERLQEAVDNRNDLLAEAYNALERIDVDTPDDMHIGEWHYECRKIAREAIKGETSED